MRPGDVGRDDTGQKSERSAPGDNNNDGRLMVLFLRVRAASQSGSGGGTESVSE
jgi:hypothetical protein